MYSLTETPAYNHVFQVLEDYRCLQTQHQDIYWTLVSNILFVIFLLQHNYNMTIVFLTTRVKQPNMYTYKKLYCRVIFIRDQMETPLALETSKSIVIIWWIDTTYGVHQ